MDVSSLASGTQLGNFRIKKLLGKGGMGEVYLAEDVRLKRDVALKVLPAHLSENKSYLSRFRREAQSAASLHHSNICVIHEIGEVDGHSYIAMEYIEGVSLRQYLAEHTLKLDEVLQIAVQIAEALDQARKKNIVHRDIKPANIMLTSSKQVKILDFGLSKQLHDANQQLSNAATESRVTQEGVTVGTVAYMSPEQALGKEIDLRSDIFSFGIVLYEMLTGRLPFSGNSSAQLLNAIVNHEPTSIPRYNDNVPDVLLRVVNKMLRKDPDDRYQSVHDVWTDLRQIKVETTLSSIATTTAKKKSKWTLFAIIVVAIGSGLIYWRSIHYLSSSSSSIPNIKSLVALPCKVYGSAEMNYLTDAVPSTLSTHLASIHQIQTKIPPTSLEVEKLNGNLDRISEAYQVDSFVASSIMAAENRFVLNVQLVDANSKRVLWSKEYEGTPNGYIDLTRQAADGIRHAISPSANQVQTAPTLPRSSDAELAYRQGEYYYNRYNNLREDRDFDLAMDAFKKSLQLDPMLADAAANIAVLHTFKFETYSASKDLLNAANSWAQRALKINQHSGRAWYAITFVEGVNGSVPKALRLALKGATLAPDEVLIQYAVASMGFGNYSCLLSMPIFTKARQMDPLYVYPIYNGATNLSLIGRPSDGLTWVNEALELEPKAPYGLLHKAGILFVLNRTSEAAILLKSLESKELETKIPLSQLDMLNAARALEIKNNQEAEKYLHSALKDPNVILWIQTLAVVPVLIRNEKKDETFQLMNRMAQANFLPYDFLVLNPDLQQLRGDAEFEELVKRTKAHFDSMMEIIEEARSNGEFPKYLEAPLRDLLAEIKKMERE
jgi:eukaryotic-like serine/threonine-protein kinase